MREVAVPRRSARSDTVRGSTPEPEICVSDWPAVIGASLLEAVTLNEARRDTLSIAEIVATTTILWFGGQRLHDAAGMPVIFGAARSIAIRSVRGVSAFPARSVAEYVSVV